MRLGRATFSLGAWGYVRLSAKHQTWWQRLGMPCSVNISLSTKRGKSFAFVSRYVRRV